MKNQFEYQLQKQVCKYLDLQYPNVLYFSDTIASCKLTMPQAIRNKAIQKDGFKCPDILILEPNNAYHGLMIELKINSPFKIDNITLKKNTHIEDQQKSLEDLRKKGFKAEFSVGFEETKKIIDDYFSS